MIDIRKLIESMNTKDVILKVKDITELMREYSNITFDEVKREIQVKADTSDSNRFELTYPQIIEQELPEYSLANDQYAIKRLPPAGSFVRLIPRVKKYPLGLLMIEFVCFNEHLNQSDNRHLKDQMAFDKSGYYIFDYKKNEYLTVDTDIMVKAMYERKVGRLDLKELEKKNKRAFEYISRLDELDSIKDKLKKEYSKQSDYFLYDVMNYKYYITIDESVEVYLKGWKKYYDSHFNNWLFTKYLFDLITEEEYYIYKNLKETNEYRIEKSLEFLLSLEMKLSEITSDHYDKSEVDKANYITETLSVLNALTRDRSPTANEGYVKAKNKNDESVAIESMREIEKRNMVLKDKVTREEIEKEKAIYLKNNP